MDKFKRIFPKNLKIYLVTIIVFSFFSQVYSQDWKKQESNHFVIYYNNASQKFLDRVLERAESCYRKVAQELGYFREDPWLRSKKALIYVFDNKEKYLDETGMPEWSQGSSLPLEKRINTYAGAYPFLDYTIIHEVTHIIFAEFLGNKRAPLWLEEGVAVFMERRDSALKLKEKMADLIRKDNYIPFEKILSLDFDGLDKERNPSEEIQAISFVEKFYLQSWSMVYFLITQYDIFEFRELVGNLRESRGFKESFLRTYRNFIDLEEFENKWREFYQ